MTLRPGPAIIEKHQFIANDRPNTGQTDEKKRAQTNNSTGRLNNVEDTMKEVFRNQQLTYELIAALFGEDCIDEDE